MNTKVRGLALYFSAAVVLLCSTVLATSTAKSDFQRETEEDLAVLATAMQTAHDSARQFIDTFSNIQVGPRVLGDIESLQAAQARVTRTLHGDEVAVTNTTTVAQADTTDKSSVHNSETEPSPRSSNSSVVPTSIEPASSVESDVESASNITKLVTPEEAVISVLGNDTESELSQRSSNSSDASTSISDYLISLGSFQNPTFLNEIPLPIFTMNNSSESSRQDVPASVINNTNIGILEEIDSLGKDIVSVLGIGNITKPDNVPMNISTTTVSDVVFNNVSNSTEAESSKLTSPFRNLIDVINSVFQENSFYRVKSGDTSSQGDTPAQDVAQKYKVSLVNISSPKMQLDTKPINSVFDFLQRISEINPLLKDGGNW